MTLTSAATAPTGPPTPRPTRVVLTRRRRRSDPPEPDWRKAAACASLDLDLFFPVSTVGTIAARQVAAAKEVCSGCPVQQSCLEWALEVGPEFGIFGGRTETERRVLRSERLPRPRRS